MKTLLTFIWLLPQNLVGLLVLLVTKLQGAKSETYNGTIITRWKYGSGVSLGQFIFVSKYADEDTVKHEYGHFLNGLLVSWLYLLVIGLPSFLWAAFGGRYRRKHNISYYDFYTEKLADFFGGVERK